MNKALQDGKTPLNIVASKVLAKVYAIVHEFDCGANKSIELTDLQFLRDDITSNVATAVTKDKHLSVSVKFYSSNYVENKTSFMQIIKFPQCVCYVTYMAIAYSVIFLNGNCSTKFQNDKLPTTFR